MGTKIGPNALIQTIRALRETSCEATTADVITKAALHNLHPAEMVDESEFARLINALTQVFPQEEAEAILYASGQHTAAYLLAHRIPVFFQTVLRLAPRRAAMWLLLVAIKQHAWTFAGSGRFGYQVGPTTEITVMSSMAPAASGFYGGTFAHLITTLIDPQTTMTTHITPQTAGTFCTYTFKRG